jgi:hypothetical protein
MKCSTSALDFNACRELISAESNYFTNPDVFYRNAGCGLRERAEELSLGQQSVPFLLVALLLLFS